MFILVNLEMQSQTEFLLFFNLLLWTNLALITFFCVVGSKRYINWPVCCRDCSLRKVTFVVYNWVFLFISMFCCLTLRIGLWMSSLSVLADCFPSLLFMFSSGMLWKYLLYTLQGSCWKAFYHELHVIIIALVHWPPNHVFSCRLYSCVLLSQV